MTKDKFVVRSGPHLWVSKLLLERGPLSTKKIWEEYCKDLTVEKDLIKSKHFLKDRVLHTMFMAGKIKRGKAVDMPKFKNAGWEVIQNKAFARVDVTIMASLNPLPQSNRKDYKKYLEENNIPFSF